MTVIGTAEVLVVANTSMLAKELQASSAPAFSTLEKDAAVSGELAGAGLAGGVTSETKKLEGDLAAHGEKSGNAFGKSLTGAVKSHSSGFASTLSSFGVPASMMSGWGMAAVAVGAVGAVAIHLGSQMQTANVSIANASGTTVKAASAIGDAFLGTAFKSEFTGTEMAKAFAGVAGELKGVEGHALNVAEAMKVMTAADDLATAKQMDLGSATKDVGGVMQAFQLHTKDAAMVSDVLFNATNMTGVGMDQFVMSVERVRAKLGAMAPPLTSLSGLLVDMTQHGITGRAAMMALTGAYTNIEKAATAVGPKAVATNAAFAALGVAAKDAHGKITPMSTIIADLSPRFAKMTETQKLAAATTIFGASAAKQMTAVVDAGVGAYDRSTTSVGKMGSAHSAAALQSQTLGVESKKMMSGLEDLGTKLGLVLVPALTRVIGGILSLVQSMSGLGPVVAQVAAIIGPVLGVAFKYIGDTIKDLVQVIKGIDEFLTGIFTGNWSKAWQGIKDIFGGVIKGLITEFTLFPTMILALMGTSMSQLGSKVLSGLSIIINYFRQLPSQVLSVLSNLVSTIFSPMLAAPGWINSNVISPIVKWFSGLPGKIGSALGGVGSAIGNAFSSVVGAISSPFTTAFGIIKNVWDSTVGGFSFHVGGGSIGPIHIPSIGFTIPRMAEGGIVTKPTFALIGEAGPEAVIPLSGLGPEAMAAFSAGSIEPMAKGRGPSAKSIASHHAAAHKKKIAAAAKAHAARIAAQVAHINAQTTDQTDTSAYQTQQIGDQNAVQLGQMGLAGLSGTALTVAQDQLQGASDTQAGDAAVRAAQVKQNADAFASPVTKALDAQRLAAAQNALAQTQATDRAKLAIDQFKDQASQATGGGGVSAPPPTPPPPPPPSTPPTLNFNIIGTQMNPSQIAGEISWLFHTGAIALSA